MPTPKYAMRDTRRPDGCYVRFERLTVDDDTYLSGDPEYAEEERSRYDAYRRGEWNYIGVRARAYVFAVSHGVGIHFSVDSPGLWAVESDSGEDHLNSLYREELATLKDMLAALASPIFEGE